MNENIKCIGQPCAITRKNNIATIFIYSSTVKVVARFCDICYSVYEESSKYEDIIKNAKLITKEEYIKYKLIG